MNIALIGYGKMGQAIEKIAITRGHNIILKINDEKNYNLQGTDVAIEFTAPSSAYHNLNTCFDQQIPVVCGTTGWLDKYEEAVTKCNERNSAFIYASNFSLGVNLFFKLNKDLAKLMAKYPDYSTEIEEIHHIHKLDKPSGTAVTLAEQIIQHTDHTNWALDASEPKDTDLNISCIREEEVPGTHTISYLSEIDRIDIKHTAFKRDGFALGAVIAAEWLQNKKGVYTMNDVLGI